MSPEIAVVVPVKNNAAALGELAGRVGSAFGENGGGSVELVYVDDGSSDGSWDVIVSLSRDFQGTGLTVRGVTLGTGRGQQSAILAGLTTCRGRRVVTLDDDLSHPPEAIPDLLRGLESGADIAYAIPPKRPAGALRGMASALHQYHMAALTGCSPAIRVGSFRAMTPNLVDRVLSSPMPFPYLSAQVLTLRPRPAVVMVSTGPWPAGPSSRFALSALFSLEWRLARYYGPAGRIPGGTKGPEAGDIAASWIAGLTP